MPPGCDFGAMADVDRRLRGRGAVGFVRFGDAAEEDDGVDGPCSCGLGVVECPLPCADGGFELELELDFDDEGCDSF